MDSRSTLDLAATPLHPSAAAPAARHDPARVPFADMARMHAPLRAELHRAALGVIDGGRYVGGEEVKAFEAEMAAWQGVPEVCGVSCATSGLFALLWALGVRAGDEVITTPHTAFPTLEAIHLAGARPVLCDLKPGYFFLDPEEVARRITPRTKVLLPVHLYGQPVELEPLLALARRHGVALLEDCAQAQGALYKGRKVGTWGDAAAFSFFPSKNLGGFGDGGAITARDPEVMRRARMFCNHGRESKYDHEFWGINSRLDALQAALLRVELPHLDAWNAHRLAAAGWYERGLAGVTAVETPRALPDTTPVHHVYVVRVPDRDALAAHLHDQGIETGIHYPSALHLLPALAELGLGPGSLPRAEEACRHVLSLPMHPTITEAEVARVCAAIRGYFAR